MKKLSLIGLFLCAAGALADDCTLFVKGGPVGFNVHGYQVVKKRRDASFEMSIKPAKGYVNAGHGQHYSLLQWHSITLLHHSGFSWQGGTRIDLTHGFLAKAVESTNTYRISRAVRAVKSVDEYDRLKEELAAYENEAVPPNSLQTYLIEFLPSCEAMLHEH